MTVPVRYVAFYLFAVCVIAEPWVLQAPADTITSKQIVSRHKAVFIRPPKHVPSFHVVDGPITGNGDIGMTVSGLPQRQRYWISKNDFWKSGPDFKQCGPSLIGGIDVGIDAIEDATYHVEQILYESAIASRFATKGNTVSMDARVLATENLIVLELSASDKPVQVQLDLWVKDGYGAKTAKGLDGHVLWATRKFNSDDLVYPSEAIIATRVFGANGTSFTLNPNEPVTVVGSVVTNHESPKYDADARNELRGLTAVDIGELKQQHDNWWQAFWAKSYVELEDKLIEKHYYASHYIMACCSRNENFPPGLYGNWITMDRLAWSGDIHLNYNHEAPFWALCSSNRVELTDSYDAPLLEGLDVFEENARKYLGKRGVYAPVGIGPKGEASRFFNKQTMDRIYRDKFGSDSYEDLTGQPMFLGQKSNAVFAAMNMLLRYQYTYDQDYIRKVYPYLSAVATFWEDYLTFEDGRYVIYNDSYGEVGPWQGKGWEKGYGDFNPITSIGFLRAFFKSMTCISCDIEVDENRLAKWEHILANLSEFPVHVEDGRKRFRACEGGDGSAAHVVGLSRIMLHALVYPATNIGLSSSPKDRQMILDDMKRWDESRWINDGNGFQTVFIAAARVGYDPDFLLAKAREKIEVYAYPNLWINAGGGGIETCSGVPGMINEMMLQSHNDVIRVFPVFPTNQKASFYRLRTFGAFLVSSAVDNGKIGSVVIESEKGRDCVLLNPWPHETVSVLRDDKQHQEMSGATLRFDTKPGEKLMLVPKAAAAGNSVAL
ncbi:MAG: hypothetical protein HQ567_00040 [Candidatus Nealsonbacteria bacterium]|nr:hypothetical protein [Candidatus Nealsonbacteria bacterium]